MSRNDKGKLVRTKLSKPDIIVMIVLTAILTYLDYQRGKVGLGAVAAVLVVAAVIYDLIMIKRGSKVFDRYLDSITNGMDETISHAVIHNPLPLCIIDNGGKILWSNFKFQELLEGKHSLKENIYELTGVKMHELTPEQLSEKTIIMNVQSKQRTFKVFISDAHTEDNIGGRMYHWLETTPLSNLKEKYKDERICLAYISVDNYDDISAISIDENKAEVGTEIEKKLRQWAVKCNGALVRMGKGKYLLMFDAKALSNIEANKFHILDEIRAIETGRDIPASLSIGVGAGGKNLAQTDEFAADALEVTLGRGGDQVVVKSGSSYRYYGGTVQTQEKRNKGRSRTVALAMRPLIDQAERVFIMGHASPDMDSFGASLGVAAIVRSRGKRARIIVDKAGSIKTPYKLAKESEQYHLINPEEAIASFVGEKDLLVIVDTHKPKMTSCPEVVEKAGHVVVIDHHIRSADIVKNPTLIHIEPYASSASELVTEMIQYAVTEKKSLQKFEAEALLAGITVDTKNFTLKTGVRTFDAASWLRRQGADTSKVKQFFQVNLEQYRLEAKIMSEAEMLPGDIAFSICKEKAEDLPVLISRAADSLLNVKGVKASVVLGVESKDKIRASARSLGEINVQLIMEKLGGGGHFTMAAAQLKGPLNMAVAETKAAVHDAVEEAKLREKANQQSEKKKDSQKEKDKESAKNGESTKNKNAAKSEASA